MATICVQTGLNPAHHILESPCQYVRCHCLNNKHSLLQSIPIHFPTILCELTHYNNTHEQQPYCVATLSQMTERSADRRVRQETGRLAGGPLLRVATIRRTTDTHYRHIPLHFSHNERNPVQISLQYFIGFRIIKEMPGSVASGTSCTLYCIFSEKLTGPNKILSLLSYMHVFIRNYTYYQNHLQTFSIIKIRI